ncbi:hypothetical protein BLSTO_02669 [Blastocystis sp. subtype 1]
MDSKDAPAQIVAECEDEETNSIDTLISTPIVDYSSNEETLEMMADAFRTILRCVGEDPDREGLKKTPMRAAQAMLFCCQGYTQSLEEVINHAVFEDAYDDMIIVKDIPMYSMFTSATFPAARCSA